MTKKKNGCEHKDFEANVNVIRLEDSGKFMADVRIKCRHCLRPFQFNGLPMGLNPNGATTDVGKMELRVSISPSELIKQVN